MQSITTDAILAMIERAIARRAASSLSGSAGVALR
jgi:hypothetical protein